MVVKSEVADATLNSRRPYLIRAMHEWMLDSDQTPHIVVDASAKGVEVPAEHVRDGRIILNISHSATNGLILGNEIVAFEARFSGRPFSIQLPVSAVLGIYARETGQGMIFSEDGGNPEPPGEQGPGQRKATGSRAHLKVIK